MSDTDEKSGAIKDSGYHSDSVSAKSPLLDEATSSESSDTEDDEPNDTKTQYHEVKAGVWTVYYIIGNVWANQLPDLNPIPQMQSVIRGLPIVWNFLLENLALGPAMFITYFLATTLSSLISSTKLYNSMMILELIESPGKDHALNLQKFEYVVTRYLLAFVADWAIKKIKLDYSTSEDPTVQNRFGRAEGYSSSAWAIIENVSNFVSIAVEFIGQTSVMIQVIKSRRDSWLFFGICMARALFSEFTSRFRGTEYYTRITDPGWLRMESLFKIGTTNEYKQDMLGDNLEGYLNTEYKKKVNELGDTRGDSPESQWLGERFLSVNELDDALESVPMLVFAWGAIRGSGSSGLSSLMLIQQATSSLQSTFSRIWHSGNSLMKLVTNIVSLSEALESKPGMPDGEVIYPEEKYADQKGMSIEFKSESPYNKAISRCGKSTTVSLISRLYDCTSGEILIDGRPLRDFKMSGVRDATCVMYQSYSQYPLTIGENILLGRPDSKTPQEDMEAAAKKAGAYNFISKLPQKFETDLSYNYSGYSSGWYEEGEENPFQKLIDAQFKTRVSGGEWRRLAVREPGWTVMGRTMLMAARTAC
ncbi:hypothetical protein FRC10_007656 [Ceratobasidium sp. 414]|nr:hypothetical protein FRC10_007656 [Ceratobasidium sp. 414]